MRKKLAVFTSCIFVFVLISATSFIFARSQEKIEQSYSRFKINGLYGLIDNDRKIKIPAVYEYIIKVGDGYFCQKQRTNADIYNLKLKKIYTSDFMMYRYGNKSQIFFIDKDSQECIFDMKSREIRRVVTNEKYSKVYYFNEDKGLVVEKGVTPFSYSVGDNKGNIIVRNIEQANILYSEGLLAVIFNDGRSGFIDETGNLVIETPFYISPDMLNSPRKQPVLNYSFGGGFALVQQKENLWKIFNRNGQSKDIPKDIMVENIISDGNLITISKINSNKKKYGYMSKDLHIEIPCIFDKAEKFFGQYACVIYQGKDGIIDREGKFYSSESIVNKK